MNRFTTSIFFAFMYLVIFTGHPANAFADGLSFNVTPMISNLSIAPGAMQTDLITVRNGAPAGTDSLRLKMTIKDWTLDQNGQAQFMDPGIDPDSCASWISITPIEISVAPSESQLIRYTVNVPPTAQGCYHCVILITTAPQPSSINKISMNVSGCIAHTIYVQVGQPVFRAKVSALSLSPNNVTLTVLNTGSSYIRVKGVIKISHSDGTAAQEINIPSSLVLPGNNNTRSITVDTTAPLAAGSYSATAILDYGGDALLGARINATLP